MEALRFSVNVPQWLTVKTLGAFSRKLFYQGPLATVKLAEVPEPSLPSPEWVKIRTLMCGFCASDLNLLLLKESPTSSPFTSFPCVMGHEVCGEIAEAGADVDDFGVGDRVVVSPGLTCAPRGIDPVCPSCAAGMISGCENFAEGCLPPGMFIGICRDTGAGFAPFFVAHKSQLFRLPDGLPAEAGIMMEPLSVGLQAVMNNPPASGDHVLIVGGGVIGNMVLQALRGLDYDCHVTVADPSPMAGTYARSAGADEVASDGDIPAAAVRVTGARRYKPMMGRDILMGGFSRIYDTVGSPQTMNTSLRCLKAGGVLSQIGIWHDLKLDLTPLWLKHLSIKGVFGCGYGLYEGERRHMFDIGLELAEKGKVKLADLVTHKFRLVEFERLIEANLAKGRHGAFKTAFTFA